MSKSKKVNKTLVRNASVPVRANSTKEKPARSKKVQFLEENPTETIQDIDFTSPEFCTLLKFAEEFKKLMNSDHQCKTHSSQAVPKYRNLNFTPQEKIFRDLVEIEIQNEQLQENKSHASLRTIPKKDAEPDFNKFLKYSLDPEYFFSSTAMPEIKKQKLKLKERSIYNKVHQLKDQVQSL